MSVWAKGMLLACALVIGVGGGIGDTRAAEKQSGTIAKSDQKAASDVKPAAIMEPPECDIGDPSCEVDPPTGSIWASPNPCTIAAEASSCTSTINWSTNDPWYTEVWVSNLNNSGMQLFARAQSGAQAASWITTSGHRFHLKSGTVTVATVDVIANPAAPYNNAAFDSQTIPSAMQTGQSYAVTVRMRNTGTTAWWPELAHRLGAQHQPDSLWIGSSRVGLPVASVQPGETATFSFNVTAPSIPGTYNFQWKMVQDGVEWFGAPSTNVVVQVAPPPLAGIHTKYDALGRVISVRQDSELGPLVTTKEYLVGFQTRVTNPRGYQTVTQYQVLDQPATDAPSGITMLAGATTVATEIYRDIFGKPTQLKRRNGDGSLSSSRYFVYDSYQRLCKTIEPETSATVMDYDAAGNLAWTAAGISAPSASSCNQTEAAASGRAVHRTYDARNRLNSLMFPDGKGNQEWQYWPDGMPKQITTYNTASATQVVNAYSYNKRRLLVGESAGQPGWYTWGIGYSYDAIGNLTGQQHPTGLYIDYAPNALGQPSRAGNFAQNASYYPNGAIKQFTYGNGIVHTMTQNARLLPKSSTDSGILSYEVGFDANGNPDVIYDRVQGDHYSRWMEYDGLDRLTAAGSCHFGGDCWHRFTYDALDNLKSWKLPGVKDYANYYYNPMNNRLTNIQNGSGATLVGLDYDAQGNLSNKNGQMYDFDFGNRLRQAVGKEIYSYDGYGRRTQTTKLDGAKSVWQYSQSGKLLFGWKGPNNEATSDYVYLGGNLVAIMERAWPSNTLLATRYQHTDALGSPVAVTNDAGQLVERTQYEPYGAAIGKPNYDGIGYTGHVMDGATGLSYMQQRYYDPQIGRFLSMDPVRANANSGGNFNRYWYADNNPYKFTDPDGRQSLLRRIVQRLPPAVTGQQNEQSDEPEVGDRSSRPRGETRPGQTRPSRPIADRPLPRSPGGEPIPDPEAEGVPHTQLGKATGRKVGEYPTAREFDASGRPVRDIDFTDHGRPKEHTNPHQHPYHDNPTGGTRQRGRAETIPGGEPGPWPEGGEAGPGPEGGEPTPIPGFP